MSKPSRTSGAMDKPRCFFVTASTVSGRAILQCTRVAELLIETLRNYVNQNRFVVHDFVVMPNHLHVLLTVAADSNLETAVQLIKGGFSYRARKECGFSGEVWQRGFSDVYVPNEASFKTHQQYIWQYPVKAGLVENQDDYPFGSAYLKREKRARAEALSSATT